MPATKQKKISCDQCQMVSIQGVPCHETGCPNADKIWVEGEWMSLYECDECGTEHDNVDDANACCGI